NFAVAVTRSRLRFLVAGVPAQPGHAPAVALDHLLRRAGVPADQPVQVDVAVQVIGLVLQAAGEETLALDLDRLTVEVETGDFRPRRPAGRERLTGYGQAAFPVVVRVRHAFRSFRGLQHGVDHQALPPLAELFVRAVVDEDAQIDADLVGRQAHTLGGVHGLEHVIGERAQRLVELLHRTRRVVQHGVAGDADRVNGHSG